MKAFADWDTEAGAFPREEDTLSPQRGLALFPASPAPGTLLTQRGVCDVPHHSDNWLLSVPQSSWQHHFGKHIVQNVGRQSNKPAVKGKATPCQ